MDNDGSQTNSGPGFARHPGYRFIIGPAQRRVRVFAGDACIADSARALVLSENTYDPAYYIPRADVRMELLALTDHDSYCPFKGSASYWTLAAPGAHREGIAWSYEAPYDEALELGQHLAFYGDRVDEILIE